MQVTNLYRSCANLSGALTASGLLQAIRAYRSGLLANSGKLAAQGQFARACADYIAAAESFDHDTRRVVERLHLTELQSEQFWSGITENAALAERQRLLVAAYSKVLFASNHLPSLMDTIRLVGGESASNDTGTLALLLLDAALPASSPDRIARAIDGIDLIYQACAAIVSRRDLVPLQLQSVVGRASRTIVLRGDLSLLSSVRHVLASAQKAAAVSQANVTDLRQQLSSMPPVVVLDKLGGLGRHNRAEIEQIRESLIAGSSMLIEAVVQIVDAEVDPIASAGVSSETFREMDDLVSKELAQHSYAMLETERARMLELADATESAAHTLAPIAPERAAGGSSSAALIDERIDELIVDLNRFYDPAGRH